MKWTHPLKWMPLCMVFVGVGCTTIQAQDAKTMLIDKLPMNLASPQPRLGEDSGEQQATMRASVLAQTQGKYKIVAERFYSLGSPVAWSGLGMSIRSDMDALKTDNEYTSELGTKPFVTVWVTRVSPIERVAIAQDHLPNQDTFVGYFELEPK